MASSKDKRTYSTIKEHGQDITYENEVIYDVDDRGRATKEMINFPKEKFDIIYADPPYPIRWIGSSSIGTKHIDYPTMPISEICLIPVKDISKDCSKLFVWSSNSFLPEILGVVKHWGFTYDKLWTWCKKTGAGGHPRNATEHLIEASRGALKSIGRYESPYNNWFEAKKGIHSEKPEIARDIIDYCYPNATKIELFARRKLLKQNWSYWGNEI